MAPSAVEVIEVDTDDDEDEEPGDSASHPSSSLASQLKFERPDDPSFPVKHEMRGFSVKREVSSFSMKQESFKREQEAIAPAAAAARAAAEAAARAAAAASAAAAAAGSGALGAKGAEEAMAEAVRAAEAARAAEVAAQAAASHRAKLDEDIAADMGHKASKLYGGGACDRKIKPEQGVDPMVKSEFHDSHVSGKKRSRASRVKREHDGSDALLDAKEEPTRSKRRVKREDAAADPELEEALRHAHAAVADVTREVKKMKEMKMQMGAADPQSTADRIVARSSAIRRRMAQGLTAMPAGTMRLAMEKMFHGKHDSSSAASALVLGQDSCAIEPHVDEAKYPMRDDTTPVQAADPNVPRSRFRGITWHRLAKKWQAVGSLHKKYKKGVYIGLFNTELDAAEARFRYHQALKARTGVDFNNLSKPWKSGVKGSIWKGLEEAPPESKAHTEVQRIGRKKFTGWHKFTFKFTRPTGEVIEYSVGRHLCSESQSAARIARLCYAKLEAGATKEEMETYAEELLCVMRMHEEEYGKHPGIEDGLRPTGQLPDAPSSRPFGRVMDAQRNRRRAGLAAPPSEMKALEDVKKSSLPSHPSGPSVADIMSGRVRDQVKKTDVKSALGILEIALVSDDSDEEPSKKIKSQGKAEPKGEHKAVFVKGEAHRCPDGESPGANAVDSVLAGDVDSSPERNPSAGQC